MIPRFFGLRLVLATFSIMLLLLSGLLAFSRQKTSTAYWITGEGGYGNTYGLYRLRPDRHSIQRLAHFPQITGHAWSPDGRSLIIAAGSHSAASSSLLYRMDLHGHRLEQVLAWPQLIYHPTFSPDSTAITFSSRGEVTGWQILQIELAELSDPHILVESSGGAWMGAWSPDGQSLAYATQRPDFDLDLYALSFNGGPTRILTSAVGSDMSPAYSPNGEWIAFMSDRSGSFHIYVMQADGKNLRQLTDGFIDERWPTWTPDGAWIIFSSIRGDGIPALYRIHPDGSDLSRLSPPDVPLASAKTSPLIDLSWHPLPLYLLAGVLGYLYRRASAWTR
jgi:Tol biopolymer transport system component